MLLSALWGVFGATWFLFALDELGLEPGGRRRGRRRRWRVVVHRRARRDAVHDALGRRPGGDRGDAARGARQPAHPAGAGRACRSSRSAFLLVQQLVADSAMTVYDVTEVSVRQALVEDRELGRVARRSRSAVRGCAARSRRSAAGSWPRRSGCGRGVPRAARRRCSRRRSSYWSPVRDLRELPVHGPAPSGRESRSTSSAISRSVPDHVREQRLDEGVRVERRAGR